MKTITRSNIHLPIAAMILTAALGTPAAAQQQVPFKGTFQGKDSVNPPMTTCATAPSICTSGTGIGTHMGEFSLTQVTSFKSFSSSTGSGHWVAANGDSIDSTFVVSAEHTPPGYVTATEIHTITGGTGRFAGAQGSFVLERLHTIALSGDATHVTFGSFHGTITPPGAAH
jgi:hypothetical protein